MVSIAGVMWQTSRHLQDTHRADHLMTTTLLDTFGTSSLSVHSWPSRKHWWSTATAQNCNTYVLAKEGEHFPLTHSNELVQHQNQESCAITAKRRKTFSKVCPHKSGHSQEKSSNDAELSWHRCLRTVKRKHVSPRELGGKFGHPGRDLGHQTAFVRWP